MCDKFLKLRQSFRITLYFIEYNDTFNFNVHVTTCCSIALYWNIRNRQSTEKHNTYQSLYINCIPPDDGLQICSKHVKVDWRNKLGINSASSWFSLHGYAKADSGWNVMALGDTREGKWRGNWRMQWAASTLHTTSVHGVSSITTADAHTLAASSRLNWRPPPIWIDSFVSLKDEIWFLRVCHHISNAVYHLV